MLREDYRIIDTHAFQALTENRLSDLALLLAAGFSRYMIIHQAVVDGNMNAVKLLLEYGCKVEDDTLVASLQYPHIAR